MHFPARVSERTAAVLARAALDVETDHAAEVVGRVDVRERIVRNREAESTTDWLPPIAGLPIDKARWRHRRSYAGVVHVVHLFCFALVGPVRREGLRQKRTGNATKSTSAGSWDRVRLMSKIVSFALFHHTSALERVDSSTIASGNESASSCQKAAAGQSTDAA